MAGSEAVASELGTSFELDLNKIYDFHSVFQLFYQILYVFKLFTPSGGVYRKLIRNKERKKEVMLIKILNVGISLQG